MEEAVLSSNVSWKCFETLLQGLQLIIVYFCQRVIISKLLHQNIPSLQFVLISNLPTGSTPYLVH